MRAEGAGFVVAVGTSRESDVSVSVCCKARCCWGLADPEMAEVKADSGEGGVFAGALARCCMRVMLSAEEVTSAVNEVAVGTSVGCEDMSLVVPCAYE